MGALGLADDVVEHAVDAEPDDEFLFERLDVDIGSLFFHCAEDQRVDELDDRRVVFGGLEDVDRAFEVVGSSNSPSILSTRLACCARKRG